MSSNPRRQPVFQERTFSPNTESAPSGGGDAAASGYISIEAEHPVRSTAEGGATWKIIDGLGRSRASITLLPTTETVTGKATLEYDFSAPNSGAAKVIVYSIPTHAIHSGLHMRYSVEIDSEKPKIVDIDTTEFGSDWGVNVLRAAAIGTTEHRLSGDGKHTLKLHPLDPGIVFDKIVIDLGGLRPSHLGPPETPPER
jgi:hypothetical protein